jgi:hypothetical protein
MRTVVHIALLVMAFAGCKSKDASPVEKMEAFADEMCACKDKDCAKSVQAEMSHYADAAKRAGDDKNVGEADMKRIHEVGTRYGECLTRELGLDSAPPAATP